MLSIEPSATTQLEISLAVKDEDNLIVPDQKRAFHQIAVLGLEGA